MVENEHHTTKQHFSDSLHITGWVVNLSDRLIIINFMGAAANGSLDTLTHTSTELCDLFVAVIKDKDIQMRSQLR